MPPARKARDVSAQERRDVLVDNDITSQIIEIKREIMMREVIYPQWVSRGRMSETTARRRMKRIRGGLKTLEAEQRKRTPEFVW